MDRPSTISLTKSMRESGYPIIEIAYLDWCGTFITYDHLAMRVWDLQGQIKCVHHNKATDSNYKLVRLSPFPALQKVIAMFTKKDASATGGLIRIYSELLSILQEVIICNAVSAGYLLRLKLLLPISPSGGARSSKDR